MPLPVAKKSQLVIVTKSATCAGVNLYGKLRYFSGKLRDNCPVSKEDRSNPPSEGQKKIQESSALLPSPKVVVDTQSENTGGSAAQVRGNRWVLLFV